MVDRVQARGATQARDAGNQTALEGRLAASRKSVNRGGCCGADARPERTGAYWPCLLSWGSGSPTDEELARMRTVARRWDSRSMLVSVDRRRQVLLFGEDSLGRGDRGRLRNATSAVVEAVRDGRPGAEIQIIIGERVGAGASVALVASRLHRLAGRYSLAQAGNALIWARRDSLAGLFETLDPRHVSAFIEGQLAVLQAHDHEHGTNLQRVLELALDHNSRNTAARAAFMHRNTFRRQLRKALELIDVDLDRPDERLALHLALKLRTLGAGSPKTGRAAARAPAPSAVKPRAGGL